MNAGSRLRGHIPTDDGTGRTRTQNQSRGFTSSPRLGTAGVPRHRRWDGTVDSRPDARPCGVFGTHCRLHVGRKASGLKGPFKRHNLEFLSVVYIPRVGSPRLPETVFSQAAAPLSGTCSCKTAFSARAAWTPLSPRAARARSSPVISVQLSHLHLSSSCLDALGPSSAGSFCKSCSPLFMAKMEGVVSPEWVFSNSEVFCPDRF